MGKKVKNIRVMFIHTMLDSFEIFVFIIEG